MSKRALEAAMKILPNYPPETYADEEEYIEVESERSLQRAFYQKGYEQAEKDLGWHSVDESLPPINEDVIVLNNNHGLTLPCPLMISFAHRVDKDETITIDGKPYKPISHNGWNIPGVKFWMPCPKIPDEE